MHKQLKMILTSFLLSWSLETWAGGSVIGNGAGLAENNFQYSFQILPKVIDNYLGSPHSVLSSFDRQLLLKIKDVAINNSVLRDRLVFVSEKLNPGFFDTGHAEENRIAKTLLSLGSPIFINLDLLYGASGEPILDLSQMQSLLIHELGHQTGIEDHNSLDVLGSKIRVFLSEIWQKLELPLPNKLGGTIRVQILNQSSPYMSSSVYFQWNGTSKVLSDRFTQDLSCRGQHEKIAGVQVYNGHFAWSSSSINTASRRTSRAFENQKSNSLLFEAWADLFCFDSERKSIRVQRITFEYRIEEGLNFIFQSFKILDDL